MHVVGYLNISQHAALSVLLLAGQGSRWRREGSLAVLGLSCCLVPFVLRETLQRNKTQF